MTSSRYSPECLGQLLQSHVVDDDEIRLQVFAQGLVLLVEGFVFHEVAHQIEDGTVEHFWPVDGLVADGLGQMGFADAGRAEEQHVFGFADEAAGGQFEDLLSVMEGLKRQSKSSRVFRARKSAALVWRGIRRCCRTLSSSWQMSSRNSAWLSRLAAASWRRTSSVWLRPERRSCFRVVWSWADGC